MDDLVSYVGLSNLSQEKRRLLEAFIAREAASGGLLIRHSCDVSDAPLSLEQARLFFLQELEPGDWNYNIPIAVRVYGALNVPALEAALLTIIERHAVLRATVTLVRGEPRAVVSQTEWHLAMTDLGAIPEPDRTLKAREIVEAQARVPFHLKTDLPIRAVLIRIRAEEHVFVLVIHHSVTDARSGEVFAQELETLYEAFTAGRKSPLPQLPIQYADYAVWQRERLQGEVLQRELEYWRTQLRGAPVLELPTVKPRPALQSQAGALYGFTMPEETSKSLGELSRREGVTSFMAVLALLNVLLHRYTGQPDLVVGTPISGRSRAELQGLIGFFLNTLVLRTDVSGDPSFRELLARVRKTALEAYEHRDLPFEKLVEELQPERAPGRTPLFQVLLVVQPEGQGELSLSGLTLRPEYFERTRAKFDLTLSVTQTEGAWKAWFEYSTDLFDEPFIIRMAGHFQRLLEQVVQNPDKRIGDLELLTPSERAQILKTWNDTARPYPDEQCVHGLFEAQVERTPNATAVIFGESRIDYRELNRRANQLAHYIRARSKPGARVGIFLERSLETVIAVVATLKAGAVCVPLDPAYPDERLRFMLEDSQATLLLTQEHLRPRVAADHLRLLCVDREWEEIAREPNGNLDSRVGPDGLLYIIYTSGSTGTPKGIALPHRALLNLLAWHWSRLMPAARTLQYAPLSFDASFHEIFSALGSGGGLYLIEEEVRHDMAALAETIEVKRIQKVILPVVVLDQLAQEFCRRDSRVPELREVIATGEQLQITRGMIEFFKRHENCTLHNHYGPSETHVVTALTLIGDPESWPARPPIGRPIANTQIYLLDRYFQPVPVGVAGELYIGGANLARGYWNRPELTVERFIPDPFSKHPGAPLYRTGDLARWLPDGNIEFLGRMDDQVKIRGYRVELGEIEAALAGHPAVAEAAVKVQEDGTGDRRLAAYVMMREAHRASSAELRKYLADKLPEYMAPAFIVELDQMPLTANGKVDRKALPPPAEVQQTQTTGHVAPRTPLEELLAGIWAEVLSVPRVGIHDNFFALGGHSLLAMRVASRVRQMLRMEVPLRWLFEATDLESFCVILTRNEAKSGQLARIATIAKRVWFQDTPLS